MWMYYIKVSYCRTGYLDWGLPWFFIHSWVLIRFFWLFFARVRRRLLATGGGPLKTFHECRSEEPSRSGAFTVCSFPCSHGQNYFCFLQNDQIFLTIFIQCAAMFVSNLSRRPKGGTLSPSLARGHGVNNFTHVPILFRLLIRFF